MYYNHDIKKKGRYDVLFLLISYKETMKKYARTVVMSVLIVLAIVSVLQGVKNALVYPEGSFDFQYDSAKLLSMKINPYNESLNSTGLADEMGLTKFYGKVEANQFPSLLIFLFPFTLFEPYIANILWLVVNLFMTVLMVILARKIFLMKLDMQWYIILVSLMLAGMGWRINIGNGQHTIFSFSFFLLALWLSEKKHWRLSGIALAISYFKYTLTLPLALYFVYKRRYKEIAVSVSIHVILTVLGAWWLNDSFINMIISPLKISVQSSASGYIDFGAVLNIGAERGIMIALSMCILIFIMSLMRMGTTEHRLLFYAIISYVSLIIIYHRVYDFFILFIPMGIYLQFYLGGGMTKEVYLPSLILSVIIFVYANFMERLLHFFYERSTIMNAMMSVFTILYAVVVYIFTAYQIVCYIREYLRDESLGTQ